MSRDDRLLTEFTVTPMIQHAVALLRAAIPAGVNEFHVGICDGHIEGRPRRSGLTESQIAAVYMLIGVAAYYHELMTQAYGEIDNRTGKAPEAGRVARQAFAADVRRKLSIEVDGYVVEDEWHGGLTVYR